MSSRFGLSVPPGGRLMRNYEKWQRLAGDTAKPPLHDGALMFWRAYVNRPWRHITKRRLSESQAVAVMVGSAILLILSLATFAGRLLGIGFTITLSVAAGIAASVYIAYGLYVAWWELTGSELIRPRPNWVVWPRLDNLLEKPGGPRGLLVLPVLPFVWVTLNAAYTFMALGEAFKYLMRPLPERGVVRPAWNTTMRLVKSHRIALAIVIVSSLVFFWVGNGPAVAVLAAAISPLCYSVTLFAGMLIAGYLDHRTAKLHAKHQPALQQLILQVFSNEALYGWVCHYQGENTATRTARRHMMNGLEEEQGGLLPIALTASELTAIVQAYAAATEQPPLVSREVLAQLAAATERSWLGYHGWRIYQRLTPQLTLRDKLLPPLPRQGQEEEQEAPVQ